MAGVCFGCAGTFERAFLEEVGDQLFCHLCLGRLLRKVDDRGSVASVPVSLPAEPPCFVCGGPLQGEEFVRLHGFAICTGCSRAFAGEEPIDEGPTPVGPGLTPVTGDAADDDEPRAPPGSGTEWCAACGRPMPGPGSYHIIEGRPHCAACAATRPASSRGEPCDACRRVTRVEVLTTTRGFRLCAACLENDPELALAVAQARHRRRLERQGRRLLGEGEDD
jgi:hypothetical protein